MIPSVGNIVTMESDKQALLRENELQLQPRAVQTDQCAIFWTKYVSRGDGETQTDTVFAETATSSARAEPAHLQTPDGGWHVLCAEN